MKSKIILFDLDGTLIDSTEAILESFGVAFETFGSVVPSAEAIKAQIGHPLDVMFATLGVDSKEVWDYVDAYKRHYREISCQKTVLLPEAREAVALAKESAILGVVTTKTAKYSIELLEYMGLMDAFDVLIGREDVTYPKPNPEPIEKALEKLPRVTGTISMVGDTCMDMEAAKAANIAGVGVCCGYGTQESLTKCASKVCKNALEAVQYIAKQ